MRHGWLVFALALVAGLVPPIIASIVFAREGRLFLRDVEAIERNRARIRTISIPLGWLLAVLFIVLLEVLGDRSRTILLCVCAGVMIGFWPGLVANFLRLRREVWKSKVSPHE